MRSAQPRRHYRSRGRAALLQPPVLLCGHSYGGAVITEAAAGPHPAVRHLVYLAGAVPDEGDSLADLAPGPAQGGREQAADREAGGEAVTVRADGMIELQPGSDSQEIAA